MQNIERNVFKPNHPKTSPSLFLGNSCSIGLDSRILILIEIANAHSAYDLMTVRKFSGRLENRSVS